MSIDVGIKHLAICIMERNENNYSLLLWEVYNTMAKEEQENICNGKFKNGKDCTRKSLMKTDLKFFCKTHSPIDAKKIKPKKKVFQMSYTEIGTGLLCCMENLFTNHSEIMDRVDKIGIELQLAKNPRMKFASHCILAKLIDIYRQREIQIPITFMRASLKLKIRYTGPPVIYTVKNAYSKRKQCAIMYTRHFLEELCISEEWIDKFNNCPSKRDDLADVKLYCLLLLGYPREKIIRTKRKIKKK